MTSRSFAALAAVLLGLTACRGGDAEARAAVTVDSARPASGALAQFRQSLPETRVLGGGFATDRDTLVARFVSALERADTSAFSPMMLDRAEFAWLYYETDPQAKPPYELPPELMWMQSMQQGERGIGRALARYGGRPLAFRGYTCERHEDRGSIEVWTDCRMDVVSDGGARMNVRLFGGIVEHAGRYKLLSFANEL